MSISVGAAWATHFQRKPWQVYPRLRDGYKPPALFVQATDIGWRYPHRMGSEVLATALTAIGSNLQVRCAFTNDDASGTILAINLVRW